MTNRAVRRREFVKLLSVVDRRCQQLDSRFWLGLARLTRNVHWNAIKCPAPRKLPEYFSSFPARPDISGPTGAQLMARSTKALPSGHCSLLTSATFEKYHPEIIYRSVINNSRIYSQCGDKIDFAAYVDFQIIFSIRIKYI